MRTENENIKAGLGQCVAEMVAAQQVNLKAGLGDQSVYGCVTTGMDWKFLVLRDRTLAIDQRDYFINEVSLLLSITQYYSVFCYSPFTRGYTMPNRG